MDRCARETVLCRTTPVGALELQSETREISCTAQILGRYQGGLSDRLVKDSEELIGGESRFHGPGFCLASHFIEAHHYATVDKGFLRGFTIGRKRGELS